MRFEHWLYTAPLRLRSLFRRKRVELELDEELAFHLEQKTEEFVAQGMTPAEARQAATRAMGGLAQRKEECRDMRQVNGIENAVRDVRYGLRVLAKSPGFTTVAVLTLALAIGANAVVFGVLNGLVLKPLNVPDSASLYGLERGKNGYQSYPDYTDLRDQNRSFDQLAAFNINQVSFDTSDNPIPTWAYETSGNYFDALRLQPYLGRFFRSSDEQGPNSAPYVVLGYDYWRSHFLEDRSVVGRVVRVNKQPFTIIGVAPPEFRGTLLFFAPDIFVPIVNHESVNPTEKLSVRSNHWVFETFGHLKPGVTPAQAKADLDSIGDYLSKTYPKEEDAGLTFALARPSLYGNFLGGPVRAFVAGLTLLAVLILLAACANLGSLFAARASRPLSRSRSAPRTRSEPPAHPAAALHRSHADLARRRRIRLSRECRALAMARFLATVSQVPCSRACPAGSECVHRRAAPRPVEWLPLRTGSSAPSTADRSLSDRQRRSDYVRPKAFDARRAASSADRNLRRAGDFVHGRLARIEAIA